MELKELFPLLYSSLSWQIILAVLVILALRLTISYLQYKNTLKDIAIEEREEDTQEEFIAPHEDDNDYKPIPYKPDRYNDEEMTKRSAEMYEFMRKRRSCRFFSDEHVPIEVIENIIKTAGKTVILVIQEK